MSRTKSKRPELHRYSGPELSELLDQVAARHGSDAAISSVNRIRTGGIAGFFCKEEFEILVEPDRVGTVGELPMDRSAPTIAAARAASIVDPQPMTTADTTPKPPGAATTNGRTSAVDESSVRVVVPDPPRLPEPPRVVAPTPTPMPTPTPTPTPAPAAAAVQVPFDPSIDPEPIVVPDPVPLGGPRPPDLSLRADPDPEVQAVSSFSDRVEPPADDLDVRALRSEAISIEKPTPEQDRPNPLRPRSGEPVPVIPGLARPVAPAPASSAAGVRKLSDATPVAPAIEAAMLLTEEQARTSPFWLELYRTQRELASFMPLASPFVTVVGTLAQAMTVTRRLRQGPSMGEAEVYVLTDRAGIVSEPMWNLVRSGRRLLEIAAQRAELPTILIIDVPDDHPNWLFPLQNRLRLAGVSLFHYVVNGRPSERDLERFRQGTDLPYAIDLVARLEPEKVLEFIERRHPIASVSGTMLTAEFLVAMRRQVSGIGALR